MTKGPIQFLMILLAALSAFTLPEAKSQVREVAQGLFVPVAWPVRTIGLAISSRLSPRVEKDLLSPDKARTADELRRQNAELLTRILNLEAQLEDLKQLSAQYQQLGTDLRKLVQPATVVAGPAGNRQTLTIGTGALKTVREGMAVVHPLGFVGQIYAVAPGAATARVLLVTDPQSKIAARFFRFARRADGSLATVPVNVPAPLVEGDGSGMVVRMLPARDVRKAVKVGDTVVLDEPKLPPALKGLRIGTVTAIDLPPTDSGHATIKVEPTGDLTHLHEVLVVSK